MGRIRTIKPELFKHEELFKAERETGLPLRLSFIGLFCQCDREGRFKWREMTLESEVLPFDRTDFSRVLDALVTRGFLVKYESGGEKYGAIPTFLRHQVINNRESASGIPPPPKDPVSSGFDACATRAQREADENAVLKSGRERKGREQESKPKAPAPPPFVLPPWVPADAWAGYVEMRRASRKPPKTTHALELLVAQLEKLRDAGDDPRAVLDQSTANSWTSLCPLHRTANATPAKFDVLAEVNRRRSA